MIDGLANQHEPLPLRVVDAIAGIVCGIAFVAGAAVLAGMLVVLIGGL